MFRVHLHEYLFVVMKVMKRALNGVFINTFYAPNEINMTFEIKIT